MPVWSYMVKVKELIEKLKEYDEDMEVYYPDSEHGDWNYPVDTITIEIIKEDTYKSVVMLRE
jgi:hypothetical protein